MPAIILTIAGWFGINPLRLILYASLAVAVIVGAVALRQHYVNVGWNKAIVAVKKQDARAVSAAEKVEQKAPTCNETNGYWDVITQACKLEDAP